MRRPLPTPVDPAAVANACAEPAPALLRHGVEEYNRGEYYACHEILERLWREEERPIRRLAQGILQVGVAWYKLYTQRNRAGAVALLDRGIANLTGIPDRCHGLDIAAFRADAERCRGELRRLGPERFAEFDHALLPRLVYVSSHAEDPT